MACQVERASDTLTGAYSNDAPPARRRRAERPAINNTTAATPHNTAHQSPHLVRIVINRLGWRSATRKPCSPTPRLFNTRP